jgi:hypothetical protein
VFGEGLSLMLLIDLGNLFSKNGRRDAAPPLKERHPAEDARAALF